MNKHLFIFTLLVLLIAACTKDRTVLSDELDSEFITNIRASSPDGTLDFYKLPEEDDYANIPQDAKNPLTAEKVALGKLLYFDPAFAQNPKKEEGRGTYSCASCHIPEAGFKPNTFQGIADGGLGFGIDGASRFKMNSYEEADLDVQSARPLTMVNVAYVRNTFWNGQFGAYGVNEGTEHLWDNDEATERNHQGFEGIETQNFEGLLSHRLHFDETLVTDYGYKEMFDAAFPTLNTDDRYSTRTASFAISAYIRTIISNKAPFQNWLRGMKNALNYEQKKGGILFFGKALCSRCHYNQNLGSLEFHALGVKDMYQRDSFDAHENDKRNKGRGGFTLDVADYYKFKVPGIYNAEDTKFFFHGASVEGLEDLIEYKNLAVSENYNVPDSLLSEKFQALFLSEVEKAHLVDFIRFGLKDPDLLRYKPEQVLSGLCYPNNDFQSQLDLGCN